MPERLSATRVVLIVASLALVWVAAPAALGQVSEPPPGPDPAGQQQVTLPGPIGGAGQRAISEETLDTLLEALERQRAERAQAQAAVAAATTAEERSETMARLAALNAQVARSEQRFTAVAANADLSLFNEEQVSFDLMREVQGLLEPVIFQLKSVSEGPRRIQQLDRAIDDAHSRQAAAQRVLVGIDRRLGDVRSARLRAELEAIRADWSGRIDDFATSLRVAEAERRALESQRVPFLEASGQWIDEAFRRRGQTILLAIAAALGVVLLFRLVRRGLSRVRHLREQRQRSFYSRVVDVLWTALTLLAAFAAVLVVFYLADDWLMLVLVLIFCAGLGWASVQILPNLVEQIRTVLNLGGVREGERLLWNGVPYLAERLGFYSKLVNPALSGGLLRVPVRELIGRHSRPVASAERWFPSGEGDWVLLSDGTRAQVLTQTPESVRLQLPGGGSKTYPTAEYCSLSPQILSEGFRIDAVFGIDYAHQATSTTEIPERMRVHLERGLRAVVAAQHIRRVQVSFKAAAASSLDYQVQADFDGAAAEAYKRLQFAVQTILVDACNEHGWVIPFQQITLHTASAGDASGA